MGFKYPSTPFSCDESSDYFFTNLYMIASHVYIMYEDMRSIPPGILRGVRACKKHVTLISSKSIFFHIEGN